MPRKATTHLYAELRAFERLMLLIATLVNYPGVGSSDASDGVDRKSEEHHDALAEVSVRLQEIARDCGIDLPAYSVHTLRKDLRTLRRYKILDERMYRWGYYLGTGAMNQTELQLALNALRSQAKYQQEPQIQRIYQVLMRRLRGLELTGEFCYPVRAQIIRAKSNFFIAPRWLQTSPTRSPGHERLRNHPGSQTSASLIQALKDLKWVL